MARDMSDEGASISPTAIPVDAMTEPDDHLRAIADPRPISTARMLALHLVPGAVGGLVYVLAAGPVMAAGFPPLMALLIAIVIAIVPFELGVIVRAGRREAAGGPDRFLPAVRYREPIRARDWLWVPVLLVAAILGFGLFGVVDGPIRDALFGWAPDWFRDPFLSDDPKRFGSSAWTITLAAYALLNVIVGPVVEELYFRGYLLPRMTAYGRWAPLIDVALFSLYHVWAPWGFLSRVAGVAPYAYVVWWKHNLYLGMAVHMLLNAIGTATVIALVLSRS
jgi:membrane protease YdiL (CAAX protease family)